MKLDKETLIKQRFWFLLGLSVPLLLIVWIMLITGVAGTVKTVSAIAGQTVDQGAVLVVVE